MEENISSPRLLQAWSEIEDVLRKYDIAGVVLLHDGHMKVGEEGKGEFRYVLDPSYSCVRITPEGIRFRAKATDYPGGAQERNEKIEKSVNMIAILADMSLMNVKNMRAMMELLDGNMDIEKGEGKFQPAKDSKGKR